MKINMKNKNIIYSSNIFLVNPPDSLKNKPIGLNIFMALTQ